MSMLSAQIDELRNAAEFYDGFKAANLMRDAADTIWQLRDDLQRTNAENAKLRELVKRMHGHIRQTCGECDGWYCSSFDEDNECCVYDTLVRELGTEVD